ncbi:hypothetical protein GCM10027187_18790 [Streptosporangium sandarakinum]
MGCVEIRCARKRSLTAATGVNSERSLTSGGQEARCAEIEITIRDDQRMKRMSVALVAGLLSVAIPGGAVHAAPASKSLDSVIKATKKRSAQKSSMRFPIKRRGGPPATWDMKASGAYRFRASGVYAADTTEITQESEGTGRSRGISIGRESYSQATCDPRTAPTSGSRRRQWGSGSTGGTSPGSSGERT